MSKWHGSPESVSEFRTEEPRRRIVLFQGVHLDVVARKSWKVCWSESCDRFCTGGQWNDESLRERVEILFIPPLAIQIAVIGSVVTSARQHRQRLFLHSTDSLCYLIRPIHAWLRPGRNQSHSTWDRRGCPYEWNIANLEISRKHCSRGHSQNIP
jgi:hypothetical protein